MLSICSCKYALKNLQNCGCTQKCAAAIIGPLYRGVIFHVIVITFIFQKQKQTPSQVPLRDREERPFLYNRPHSPGREIDIIDTHAPFYHQSINPAQYDYEYNAEPANFREPANFDNLVNHSGSTLDDSNLKEGESVLDGSDSYSGSDKSRDVYQRNKVQ